MLRFWIVPSLFDGVVGVLLVRGDARWLRYVPFRAAFSLVAWSAILLPQRDFLPLLWRMLLWTALLLLAIGNPKRLRVGVAVAILALFLGLSAQQFLTRSPLVLQTLGEIEKLPTSRVEGIARRYVMQAPSDAWYLRNAAKAKQSAPDADRWLQRPDRFAHLLVSAHPSGTSTLPALVEAAQREFVRQGMRRASDVSVCPGTREPCAYFEGDWSLAGTNHRLINATLVAHGTVVQVMAYAPAMGFASLRPELMRAIESVVIAE